MIEIICAYSVWIMPQTYNFEQTFKFCPTNVLKSVCQVSPTVLDQVVVWKHASEIIWSKKRLQNFTFLPNNWTICALFDPQKPCLVTIHPHPSMGLPSVSISDIFYPTLSDKSETDNHSDNASNTFISARDVKGGSDS